MSDVTLIKVPNNLQLEVVYASQITHAEATDQSGGSSQVQEEYIDTGLTNGNYYVSTFYNYTLAGRWSSALDPLVVLYSDRIGTHCFTYTKIVNDQLRIYNKRVTWATGQNEVRARFIVYRIRSI